MTRPFYRMRTGSPRHVFFETWVEGVAQHIHDPVQRLRFVRIAVPCQPPAPPVPRRVRAMMFPSAIAVVLFLLLASATAYLAFHENAGRPGTTHASTVLFAPRSLGTKKVEAVTGGLTGQRP